jgi:surface antigen
LRPTAPANRAPCPLYRTSPRHGLLPIRQIAAAMVVMALGSVAGGCSYKLGNMFGGDKKNVAAADDLTGSITPVRLHDDTNLTDSDLALARNAASDVLTRGNKDASQPWENPQTGARGSVTPLASAYTGDDGRPCRDFLASYVRGTNEGWLQGEACQSGTGAWEIRNMKPWKRS